jgi:ribosomal protein S18 acetylase RimI-like enzyme
MNSLINDQNDCFLADYCNPRHASAIIYLLDSYACDPMGGGQPLSDVVKENLVSELAKLPHAYSVLCFVADQPAGLANCFTGFSTFACKPLVNVHDITVHKDYRGLRLSQALLHYIEEDARRRGCCKITLEVLQGNEIAQHAYAKFGFYPYELNAAHGQAMFMEKKLTQI